MSIQEEREEFEKFKAKQIGIDYDELKKDLDGCERIFPNNRYAGWDFKSDWELWQAAKSQVVPEGFVLVPTEKVKYFSHDGENYEIHNTLAEAKYEAECAIENFSERLADQICDPRSDGNFRDVGYGIVLGKSGYSVDHIVTEEDVENGEYGYEAGTEIMSLFLIDAQEQSHD